MINRKATIVVDLGFGDAGKGTIVDYLARERPTAMVVRFNGGAQAAHNVHTPDGRHHTFAQFGSGTFVPGVKTFLSRFMLIDPPALLAEAAHLEALGVAAPLTRLAIDRSAKIVTPFHKAANRIREVLRGSGNHGSVGMGVGETMADSIAFPQRTMYAADLRDPETMIEKLRFFQALKREEFRGELGRIRSEAALRDEARLIEADDAPESVAAALWRSGMRLTLADSAYLKREGLRGDLIFEGAQGVLIDEWHGFHPYTTWSTTTFDNAEAVLSDIGFDGPIERLGVLRTYATRHGAGPFPTEDRGLTLALPDEHNTFGRWQGGFRIGWFDAVLARYAIEVCGGVDSLALTHLDRIHGLANAKMAVGYRVPGFTRDERAASVEAERCGEKPVLTGLRKKPFLQDLHYQEILTRIVQKAVPLYVSMPADVVGAIERELRTPVSIVSRGKTAAHKARRAILRAAA